MKNGWINNAVKGQCEQAACDWMRTSSCRASAWHTRLGGFPDSSDCTQRATG